MVGAVIENEDCRNWSMSGVMIFDNLTWQASNENTVVRYNFGGVIFDC